MSRADEWRAYQRLVDERRDRIERRFWYKVGAMTLVVALAIVASIVNRPPAPECCECPKGAR